MMKVMEAMMMELMDGNHYRDFCDFVDSDLRRIYNERNEGRGSS
jgi:hypothetical protein